jgi:hypothetical protein
LVLGASLLLVSAATGCAAGYQPYATTTLATPVVHAEVAAPAPVIDAQVQLAPVQQPVVVQQPDLVTITPDVQVVAAYDAEPVFYTGGFYWRERDGGWYRSHSHDTGWTSYRDVPYAVRSIENRGSYRNYRPAGYQPRSYADHRDQRPSYDRGYQPRPSRGYDRPSGGYNQPTGYNRPQAQRPAYGNTGYSNPRPSYNQGSPGYQPRPSQGYSNPRPSGYTSGRPSSGYNQPRPSSGYNQGSPGYQPRPSSGYTSGRPAGYQPRPSQSYSGGRAPGYQPRPSQSSSSSYGRPASSSYKRQPTTTSSRRR